MPPIVVGAEELRAVLPQAIAAQLDLSSLQPLPVRFADAKLQGAESDLLFSARVAGRKALLYVLVEHQSVPDRFMPLRLLRYIGRILDRYRRDHPRARRLPAVIPIVLCHDLQPWPYPADLGAARGPTRVYCPGRRDPSPPPAHLRASACRQQVGDDHEDHRRATDRRR